MNWERSKKEIALRRSLDYVGKTKEDFPNATTGNQCGCGLDRAAFKSRKEWDEHRKLPTCEGRQDASENLPT